MTAAPGDWTTPLPPQAVPTAKTVEMLTTSLQNAAGISNEAPRYVSFDNDLPETWQPLGPTLMGLWRLTSRRVSQIRRALEALTDLMGDDVVLSVKMAEAAALLRRAAWCLVMVRVIMLRKPLRPKSDRAACHACMGWPMWSWDAGPVTCQRLLRRSFHTALEGTAWSKLLVARGM